MGKVPMRNRAGCSLTIKDTMRVSKLVPGTLRDNPNEASTPSHRLLLRGGFIRQLTAGIYVYTHLGLRVIQKIEQIVREEMNRADAIEVLLPILHPREIWEETGRWEVYKETSTFFTTTDRKKQELALAPTAEEVITWLVRESVRSWRQLPVTLYQIGPKFRDELRPRFGVVRGREFIMKDAYSFDRDEAAMRDSYAAQREAYNRIFNRCGLKFRMVEADSGAIGGSGSAEFMVLADTGEDFIITCDTCDYGANQEKAVSHLTPNDSSLEEHAAHLEDTPNARTVDDLCGLFGMTAAQMVKTIIYMADGNPVAVCIRGDQEINEVKLANKIGALKVELADEETVQEVTGAEVGFAGPIGLKADCPILFDISVQGIKNFLCGGNATDKHWLDVNLGREVPMPAEFHDLRNALPGDTCAVCGKGTIGVTKGIEVGHIFQLGTKYSKSMHATYTDESGNERVIWMGCYGIGVSRIMAACIEQNYDDDGMRWPVSLTPYDALIVSTGVAELPIAESLYKDLQAQGVEVMIDDRDERAGVKFKDADLLGVPYHIVVGRKAKDGVAEVKERSTGLRTDVPFAELGAFLNSKKSS